MADVFDQGTPPPNPNPVAPASPDPFADKLKAIVNEQGEPKYKDINSALDALKASQAHIATLEAEARERMAREAELTAKATKAEALEEIVRRIGTNDKATVATPPNASLSEDAIAKLVDTRLVQRDAAAVAQKNMNDVSDVLKSKFGDKAPEVVAAKAAELGTTARDLGALSSQNPKLVLSLFNLSSAPVVQPTVPSLSIPLKPDTQEVELKRPEKSLLSGIAATDRNRKALMEQIRAKVYKDNGIEA